LKPSRPAICRFIGRKETAPSGAGDRGEEFVSKTNSIWLDKPQRKKIPQVSGVRMLRLNAHAPSVEKADWLAREEPLEIRVRGRSVAVTMRTPGHDRELAAGFLLTERIVSERKQLVEIATCTASLEPQNTLDVFLAPGVEVDFARLTRHVFAASSCGLCGKASIEAVKQHFPPVNSDLSVPAGLLLTLPGQMRRAQKAFSETGGLHAAAIFSARGKLLVLREDVGRHNAVDKVLGHGFLKNQFPFAAHVLLVSGRASFEILQKSLPARIPIVCAVSAPSSLAVEFARASGQTLVGFLRDGGMNIYSHPERVAA
jgi:FdhD protein